MSCDNTASDGIGRESDVRAVADRVVKHGCAIADCIDVFHAGFLLAVYNVCAVSERFELIFTERVVRPEPDTDNYHIAGKFFFIGDNPFNFCAAFNFLNGLIVFKLNAVIF